MCGTPTAPFLRRGRSQTGPPVAGALSFHAVGAALAAARLTDCVFFVGADVPIRPLYLGIKRYAGYGGFRLRAGRGMGIFRPPGRVTFCADRKSPKNCLGEGGFRFPPSPRYPIPLKRPIRGDCGPPLLDVPPRGGGDLNRPAKNRRNRNEARWRVQLPDASAFYGAVPAIPRTSRHRSIHPSPPRGRKVRRVASCRSRRLFNRH